MSLSTCMLRLIVRKLKGPSAVVLPTLTRQRYDNLLPQARRLVRVPRYAHLLSLPHVQKIVEGERTLARYYGEAYFYVAETNRSAHLTGLLDSGMRAAPAMYLGLDHVDRRPDIDITPALRRKQVTLATKILAAMAFEMFFPSPDSAQPNDEFSDVEVPDEEARDVDQVGPLFHIVGTQRVDKFYDKVYARLNNTKIYWLEISSGRTAVDWEHDLVSLQNMNARGLEHFVIDGNKSKLQFADRTVQEFFAAVWLTNYATKEDINRMWAKVPDPWRLKEHSDYLEVWRFAAEMPRENCDDRHWIWLFSPFYDGSLSEHFREKKGSPIRSTELIYLTWDRMKDTDAGKVFRSEFESIVEGMQGDEKQRIAQRLLEGFRWDKPLCVGKHGPTDNGEFVMGCSEEHAIKWDTDRSVRNNPEHRVKLSPFWMHMYCVSNVEFELFEPRRVLDRAFSRKVPASELDDHPVVNVSWYDATCFLKWLGEIKLANGQHLRIELPTEARWEYVCRAGVEGTAFSWDGKLDDNRIESGYCNFCGNFPWGPGRKNTRTEKMGGQYLARTIPVDGRLPDGKVVGKNRWGYFQFHGNVWEWCRDWYSGLTYHARLKNVATDPVGPEWATWRVLRGGCWLYDGESCRAAFRNMWAPVHRDWDCGFRLSAVPVSPAGESVGGG